MPKWLRICLKTGAVLLGIVFLLWLALAFYIQQHRRELAAQLIERANRRLNGRLTIGDISPSLLRSFPQVSLALDNVELRDSLYTRHRHPLLAVKRIFVKVNTFTLLRHHLDVKEITLENGVFYAYTNPQGYTNMSAMKRRSRTAEKEGSRRGREADIARLELHNIHFVVDNQWKHKLFDIQVHSLKGSADADDGNWRFHIRTRLLVNSFAFNLQRGSFLKNKTLETNLELNFNRPDKVLSIPAQRININDQPYNIGATFNFNTHNFILNITAENVLFRNAASTLSDNISCKLDSIDIQKPMNVEAHIAGYLNRPGTPRVLVKWNTADNTLVTKAGEWTNCSFSGSYNNERHPGMGYTDENSAITFYGFKARWWGLPFSADTIDIVNLKHPVLSGRFKSDFNLQDLNDLTGETFRFTQGTASASLFYRGGIADGDTITPYMEGAIKLQNGAMEYLPRSMQINNCFATIAFNGQDVYVLNVHMQSAKSELQMEGNIRNLLRLYFNAPEKILMDWNITSPRVDLNEFRYFLSPRKTAVHAAKAGNRQHRKASRLAKQLGVVLELCNVNMRLHLGQLSYQHFNAQQVTAELSLTQSDILLQKIALAHAGGSLQLSGAIRQQGSNNRFKLHANINNVHINQLFYAFNNFGMESLTSRNLRGLLSAKADITGNLYDGGSIAPHSLYGTVSFNLRQGALLNFEPLEGLASLVFFNRNLSEIRFENLKNTLQLQGSKIIIPPMQINSTALNMDVTGVYGMPAGTDIYMDVPLRNPKKEEDATKAEKKERRKKGIVIHLHATDEGKGGKVKIKLGKKPM
jgi:hypothetical protein